MIMSKNGVRGCIVLVILMAVFSVIAFVAPFCMTTTFWVAYICGMIAIAFQFVIFSISFSNARVAGMLPWRSAKNSIFFMCAAVVF